MNIQQHSGVGVMATPIWVNRMALHADEDLTLWLNRGEQRANYLRVEGVINFGCIIGQGGGGGGGDE